MVDTHTTSSKREALRFPGYDLVIRYRTEYEDGEAAIDNISTSGCALKNSTVPLSINEKVLLHIELEPGSELLSIQARVKRLETNLVGLEFFNISGDHKQQLIRYFAKENRRHKLQQTP